ncbi:uncharacterized protein LOC132106952 [Carassius carassius]|uniref:uncharacterized protein LOC132106952 n=1 Tax=Carassius carassius TaxID=217509 RepID=UPI002868F8C1|nr:uncharacterized protein LOC132106952 [Carassius carassius]
MKIPPNECLNKIKLCQEPLRMVAANSNIPADEIPVPWSNHAVNNNYNIMQTSAFGGFYNDMKMVNSARWQEEQVSLDAFLKKYLEHNSMFISENDSPKEGLKHYDYEGEGSVTGSIESCSFIESNDDLEFMNKLGSKFNTLAEVCGFRQTDPKVIVNTGEITPNAAASSSHMTNIVQPSPEEIPVKSPLVQPEPNQGTVIQEPMYYVFNQPMASNVLLSENGLGQGVYIINGTSEAGRFLTQGNGHTLEHFGSGQQAVLSNNIIGDSVLYSHIGPQNPVMTTTGLGEVNPAAIQNLAPTSNLVVMPQQQLDRIVSLQMLRENGQGRVKSQLLVSGPYPSASKEGVDSRLLVSGHSILEAPVSGGNLLAAGPGQYPMSMNAGTPNLVGLPQVQTGQINNSQLLVNGVQNIVSGKGGQIRQLVSGPTILEGSSQLPLAMSSGVLSPVELPQAANRQLFRSTVSRVLTSMVMMPKSKGHATNGQWNIEQ